MNHPASAKPSPNPVPASSNGRSPASECGNCGAKKRWILHHVRIRGIHRRLCTSCVLRLHPSSFCPICFQFYDSATVPTSSKRLTCSKCASFTHPQCAPPSATAAAAATVGGGPLSSSSSNNSYLCPPCASPNFSFFDIDSDPNRGIDRKLAVVLLCAARISAASMNKAVIVARAEAERRVREAALARKRAREALDNLALLVSSRGDKAVRKDATPTAIIEGSVSELLGSANSAQKLQKEKNLPVTAAPNPPAKQQMFNGFSAPRQSPAMAATSPAFKKTENGEAAPVNGNVNGKDKLGSVDVKKEKVEMETKSHGRGEDVPPK